MQGGLMFKWILPALFFGAGISCFSEEKIENVYEASLHNESLALVYVGRGNENLIYHRDAFALEDFTKASTLLEELNPRSIELDFLICFGKVIAYDNLGLRSECQNALASLFFIIEDEEDDGTESDFLQDNLSQDYEEADMLLRQLANLAHSPKVRDLLLSLVDKMSEEVLPIFRIADSAAMEHSDWTYANHNYESMDLCKTRFWKKLEKIAKKTYNVIMKAKQVWDFVKEVNEKLG